MASTLLNSATHLQGQCSLPGDKSISHRLALLAPLAFGTTKIENFATSLDCQSSLNCMRTLGVNIEKEGNSVAIQGRGLRGLCETTEVLDAGNSGTTMRLLAGILCGQPFESQITGDESLCRRPMRRILTPLQEMGAKISASPNECAPLKIQGGNLHGITYTPPMASAQVKSCVLLAGLFADGDTTVIENIPTRDHTERILPAFGVPVHREANRLTVNGCIPLVSPTEPCTVPGDFSSAAFFLAAGMMVPKADLLLEGVGVNLSRIGLLHVLKEAGGEIKLRNERLVMGEPVADIHITGIKRRTGKPLQLSGNIIPNVIDELPILAVLGAYLDGVEIRDARELRVKESDRIHLIVENMRRMGLEVTELEDGLQAAGNQEFRGAQIETGADHRIAMAFSIAALVANGTTEIQDAFCVDISFPSFYEVLAHLTT